MRIIGGTARGRKLLAPGKRFGKTIRPTSDRAREALFNVLADRIHDCTVLDLFAGTGAFALEALSRGARSACMIDCNRGALELIQKNVEHCGFSEQSIVLKRDLTKGLSFLEAVITEKPDLIFIDPPYGKKLGLKMLEELALGSLPAAHTIIIVEDQAGEQYPVSLQNWQLFDQRRYGEAGFWLYRQEEIVE